MEGYQRFLRGSTDESNGLLDAADAIARENGLFAFQLRIQVSRLQTKEIHRHGDELAAAFAELESALIRVPPMVTAHVHWARAMCFLATGESPARNG